MTDARLVHPGEATIRVTSTERRVYDAVHAATDGGTRVFEGFLEAGDIDHSRISRALADLVRLGVVAASLVVAGCKRRGRRLQLLVPPERLQIARPAPRGRRKRVHSRPRGEDAADSRELVVEQTQAARRRRRDMQRFERAWAAAFAPGTRYEDDPRAAAPEPHLSPHRPDARVLQAARSRP